MCRMSRPYLRKAMFAFFLLILLLGTSTHAELDKTKVGIKVGDVYTYRLTDFIDEINGNIGNVGGACFPIVS